MIKTYILDTNVLLSDPKSLFDYSEGEVIVCLTVLEELDKKKVGNDEAARNARVVIRYLDEMRSLGDICDGVMTEKGGRVCIESGMHKVPDNLDANRADNKIIGVAIGLKEKGKDVIVVSNDINLRVKCGSLGLIVEDYDKDLSKNKSEDIYSGTGELFVDAEMINEFYSVGSVDASGLGSFYENQYFQLYSNTNSQQGALARYSKGRFVKLSQHKNVWGISPRNREQNFAMDAIFNPEIKLVSLLGKAGCGKSLLSLAGAVEQCINKQIYPKIILCRPLVPFHKEIGFLKGSLEDKMDPWMKPLTSILETLFSDKGKNFLEMQIENGILEVETLTFIRGMTLTGLTILDESQNLSKHELKTVLSRMGEGKIILTGDINQIDTKDDSKYTCGLTHVVEKFKGHSIAATVTLTKGERSILATLASEIL